MDPDHIDKLLERYLLLLHEYTTLRSTLESIQGAMYQNIARANFSGERGVRYGQDFYDDRMQASRRLKVTLSGEDNGVPEFSAIEEEAVLEKSQGSEKEEASDDQASPAEGSGSGDSDAGSDEENDEKRARERKKKAERNRDPLRWFGFVTPMPLRLAQDQAVQLVESVFPRLASVNAEMMDIEIEVRRARKRRAKVEAENSKTGGDDGAKGTSVGIEAA
ncbi:uncharacterized protein DNG_03805 [Cephalotrichum gorgonifer]|uniref:Vacuolar ATPase assembly protein VMA22 n=1 Tax=Cephalotrichum gorgonifer TaxID=2041049 RepID=A0AAE8MXA5_9PEZI|nr:uncharacterized protein DNG_03805 [Cephalotrichum gorgonifer]